MRRATLATPILSLLLAGCHGGLDKRAVGTWSTPQGLRLIVSEDKTYRTESGPIRSEGTWRVEGDDLVFAPGKVNGRPVADLKARLAQRIGGFSGARRTVAEKILRDVDRPNYLRLSDDGKTLTTDRAKDTNADPWPPLTKG